MREMTVATYRVVTRLPLEQAVSAIAGEQSTGTFVSVAGETDELRARHSAVVLGMTEIPAPIGEALPGARGSGPLHAALVRIGFPLDNTGPSLTNLFPVVAGNLYELRELAGLKLVDLELPDAFGRAYLPAGFAVEGTRRLAGRPDGVLIGTIVKPNVGLRPSDYVDLVLELGLAGADFIKDDEVNADCPPAPLAQRVRAVTGALDEVERRTGRRPMYAFNISDEPDRMLRHHDMVVAAGGTCVMVNLNVVGFPAVAMLRRHARVPIHAHVTGIGALARHPGLGIGHAAYQKLARLTGVDHLHCGGFHSKFYVSDDEVAAMVGAVRAPLLGGFPCLPVLSSAQWAGTAPVTLERTGTDDLLVLAGGGVLGHPDGPAAGITSIRQAWTATAAGVPLTEVDSPELYRALDHFGGVVTR
ncbi:RuBisCO large subunit C-terminal-like domain-containing protein [Nonomuraea fuscirosea]|uniref:RuBisCO large subunit C-terminal-like domain-containing protein n=1 Tax=Nonomuraea fuscirosea TaxID=1291556 RepID=UPI002DDA5582|nr:RuBisCO large subunit C-terminal-like domain-containing protein [Nonomuraea fuscirosea]WSA48848.1 RuBisCO large subunit C-terminal-like domain-containing protein [Nonomuraea fuscirosea]